MYLLLTNKMNLLDHSDPMGMAQVLLELVTYLGNGRQEDPDLSSSYIT